MSPQRTLDMPGDATHVDEAASILHEHTAGDDSAFIRHAWRWAGSVSSSQAQAETAYFAVLAAGGVDPPPAEQAAEPDPEPAKPEPDDDADPDPQPTRAPVAAPDPEPLPDTLTQQLTALAARVEEAEPTIAGQIRRWDPDEQPVLTGEVAITEWIDFHHRSGPVRVVTLLTAHGPTELFCSWQQLGARLRGEELAHGRALRPGDLLALRFAGRQRVGRSKSPSRLFTIAVEWTP